EGANLLIERLGGERGRSGLGLVADLHEPLEPLASSIDLASGVAQARAGAISLLGDHGPARWGRQGWVSQCLELFLENLDVVMCRLDLFLEGGDSSARGVELAAIGHSGTFAGSPSSTRASTTVMLSVPPMRFARPMRPRQM